MMREFTQERLNQIDKFLTQGNDYLNQFRLVEQQLQQWQQEIAQQSTLQFHKLECLNQEIDHIKEFFERINVQHFNQVAEETESQGQSYLESLKHTEQEMLRQIHCHRSEISRITQHGISEITHHMKKTINAINDELAKYDIEQYNAIASQSCKEFEESSHHLVTKSNNLFKKFHWHLFTFTLGTALTTALSIGFYLSDELPWEMHQHATNERQAGKMLLEAWPALSQNERNKILIHRTT